MPTLKFKGKAAQAVFDALTNPPRLMEWGDLYTGTGVDPFEAHKRAALASIGVTSDTAAEPK
jgi:16S rRNA G966 N2-methylase RsmD